LKSNLDFTGKIADRFQNENRGSDFDLKTVIDSGTKIDPCFFRDGF